MEIITRPMNHPSCPVPAPSHQGDWVEVSDPVALVQAPLVTVNMLTYNQEPFLAEAIEGVVRQKTTFPFELIIGEDCSKDSTRQIALDYQRRYPAIIRVQFGEKNVGAKSNSRRTRQLWRGKYIAWCEGDDYWSSEDKLQKQVTFLENNPDYGLVHSGFQTRIGNTVYPFTPALSPIPTGRVFESLLERNFIRTCTVCLRTHLAREYEHSPFWNASYLMGDYPLWLWFSQKGLVGYIDETLAIYRRVFGSMTNSSYDTCKRMAMSGREVKRDFIAHFGCRQDVHIRALQASNVMIMYMAANAGDRELFLAEYAWCRQNNPAVARAFRTRVYWLAVKLGCDFALRLRLRFSTKNLMHE
jgi:glycosyltransferase involved in cell wall biosynthesis